MFSKGVVIQLTVYGVAVPSGPSKFAFFLPNS